MLVLAAMISLSIIGAIDAMSSNEGSRIFFESPRPAAVPVEQSRPRALPRQASPASPVPSPATQVVAVEVGAPAPQDESVRWLEAIAYALMALVGLLALIALILWRSLRELRRIADRG